MDQRLKRDLRAIQVRASNHIRTAVPLTGRETASRSRRGRDASDAGDVSQRGLDGGDVLEVLGGFVGFVLQADEFGFELDDDLFWVGGEVGREDEAALARGEGGA